VLFRGRVAIHDDPTLAKARRLEMYEGIAPSTHARTARVIGANYRGVLLNLNSSKLLIAGRWSEFGSITALLMATGQFAVVNSFLSANEI
jgi:hypothetical protein